MKVLLIEDDERLAATVKRGLEQEGFAVEIATDGDEGFWRASEGGHDLIVLDIMLPKRNGFLVSRDLRAAGCWTPILMLTAKAGDLDEAEALDDGADDYLTKPFSFPVLVARLRVLARRASGRVPIRMVVGDLNVDERRRKVWRDGLPIELTAREFDVLALLVRREGEVLSKKDLLAGVWEDDFEGDPNIVEVYVARLRRKIDLPFGRHTIVTMRGAGYCVIDDLPGE